VEFENRHRIETAEGVDLDVVVAGFGSRFVAGLIDMILLVLAMLAVGLAAAVFEGFGAAILLLGGFVALFVYPVVGEVLWSGRTVGKSVTGLRVVTVDGGPVGFVTSAIRNIMRLIDILPGAYAVGTVAVLATKRSQRLGDLAAGTLVVRDRTARVAETAGFSTAPIAPMWDPAALPPETAAWDVSAVTADELATVRAFLDRRWTLAPPARAHLAVELATRLRPKVSGPPEHEGPERWLEWVVATKLSRG
jgi:uncharacterized RDD family membrane protein YckC